MLLLEAGGDDRPLRNLEPILVEHADPHADRLRQDAQRSQGQLDLRDRARPGTGGRPHKWPKGKVLGGSSSINAHALHSRAGGGLRRLGADGRRGWSYDDVLPYFRRAQNQERGECESHGVGGPLNTCDYSRAAPDVSQALLDACVEAGIPYSPDINDARAGGRHLVPAHREGRQALLDRGRLPPSGDRAVGICASRPRRETTRILFEGKRAVGVEFVQGGETKVARANAEVILAAGAVASPQAARSVGDRRRQGAAGASACRCCTNCRASARICRTIT